jgi:hypothetical protein
MSELYDDQTQLKAVRVISMVVKRAKNDQTGLSVESGLFQ